MCRERALPAAVALQLVPTAAALYHFASVARASHAVAMLRMSAMVRFCRERLAPYKRIRRIEFAELPKTISGKIRRVQLRASEHHSGRVRGPNEFWEEDV